MFMDRLVDVLLLKTLLVGLGKAPVFAIFIALIACRMGFRSPATRAAWREHHLHRGAEPGCHHHPQRHFCRDVRAVGDLMSETLIDVRDVSTTLGGILFIAL